MSIKILVAIYLGFGIGYMGSMAARSTKPWSWLKIPAFGAGVAIWPALLLDDIYGY